MLRAVPPARGRHPFETYLLVNRVRGLGPGLYRYLSVGMVEAAEAFLRVYEAEMGQPVANLGLWGLAAAARPMADIAGWLTQPTKGERFRQFIADAQRRAGCEH